MSGPKRLTIAGADLKHLTQTCEISHASMRMGSCVLALCLLLLFKGAGASLMLVASCRELLARPVVLVVKQGHCVTLALQCFAPARSAAAATTDASIHISGI